MEKERKKWRRFGGALKEQEGESVTARALEDVPFERVAQQKQTQEEKKAANIQQALQGSDKQAIVGRSAPAKASMYTGLPQAFHSCTTYTLLIYCARPASAARANSVHRFQCHKPVLTVSMLHDPFADTQQIWPCSQSVLTACHAMQLEGHAVPAKDGTPASSCERADRSSREAARG